MNSLIVVCGLPGVGKSSVAKKIEDKVQGKRFDTDVVRKEISTEPRYDSIETRTLYSRLMGVSQSPLKVIKVLSLMELSENKYIGNGLLILLTN